MSNHLHRAYEISRRASSRHSDLVNQYLEKYPTIDGVKHSSVDGGDRYRWHTDDGAEANLFISSNEHYFKLEKRDYDEKSLMMKLVSIGSSVDDVKIRKAIDSLLSELLDA